MPWPLFIQTALKSGNRVRLPHTSHAVSIFSLIDVGLGSHTNHVVLIFILQFGWSC
ncbi:unnamed protein product [Amoebophrya sp. A25]|nr:unnamed protein product [Amoebophrya sp. A25]|eukprot:GSA25T00001035001.1